MLTYARSFAHSCGERVAQRCCKWSSSAVAVRSEGVLVEAGGVLALSSRVCGRSKPVGGVMCEMLG
eukprot:10422153-Ditylum_brightwellii.AAC.1